MKTKANDEMKNTMAKIIQKAGYTGKAPVFTVEHGTATVNN